MGTIMEKTNELLKKQLRLNRLMLLFMAVILAAVVTTCVIIVRNVDSIETTVVKIDHIVDDLVVMTDELAEVDWEEMTMELETVSKELSSVNWAGLSKDIGDTAIQAQESLQVATEAVESLDIQKLNKAIAELQTVIEPLAKLVGRFG